MPSFPSIFPFIFSFSSLFSPSFCFVPQKLRLPALYWGFQIISWEFKVNTLLNFTDAVSSLFPYPGWPCFSPPLLFTLTHSCKIWPVWCLSTDRVCGSLSIHLLRSLSGGQVSMPSFWQIPPNTSEVDQSPLDSLKHLNIYIYTSKKSAMNFQFPSRCVNI